MPRIKQEGWTAKCGKSTETRKELYEHQNTCEVCINKPKNTGEWTSRCGTKFQQKALMRQHTLTCEECRKLGWGAGKTFEARCKMVFQRWRERENHQKTCESCIAIKKENIKAKNLKTNQSESHRKASSITARITSARPEIQQQRAERLKKWRKENPEKFAKCTEAAQRSSKKSRMEAWLRMQINWKGKKIRCKKRPNKKWKQVDFVKGKIWIEVDGFYHFFEHPKNVESKKFRLPTVQQRDEMLLEECIRRKDVMLIRLDMTCFHSSTGRMKTQWWTLLQSMLISVTLGIYCLGELYESCPWAKNKCTIWKSPVQPTTLYCPTEL